MAHTGAGYGQAPLGIKDITEEAGNFEFDPDVALRYWFRAADAIQKQAQSYERDGSDQDAYLFFMRHALLASEKIPKHPDYKMVEYAAPRKKMQRDLLQDLDIMEVLRPRIIERHERFERAMARRREEREQWEQEYGNDAALASDMDQMSMKASPGRRRERRELNPNRNENHGVALSLANKERKRRQGKRRESRLRQQGPVLVDEDGGAEDLAERIQATARRREQARQEYEPAGEGHDSNPQSHTSYHYPSVGPRGTYGPQTDRLPSPDDAPARPPKEYFIDQPPSRPPKHHESFSSIHSPPSRPDKRALTPPPRTATATPDISTADYTFTSTATTESGKPLRTIFLNPGLREEFLTIAHRNTIHNLETCGILCGRLISNAFFVTHLVIPDQEATSDTCDTINESDLFDYMDSHDLLSLGWIHTHPTQTCFMSSRDLHTHAGYQVQMPESIAIVMAPSKNDQGTFRLTDPPGLRSILDCKRPGLFHLHEESHLYTDATRPGHVQELGGLGFEVVDLRPEAKKG